ncbi:MAG TPA: hypothetical protein VEB20_18205 [Azospirillaceae bacterium]|nr:hypothetical protein [Azospirillaceae bacterium]
MKSPLIALLGIVTALIGLFLAAGTHDAGMYLDGMLFFAFGVALNFWLIARTDFSSARKDEATQVAAE